MSGGVADGQLRLRGRAVARSGRLWFLGAALTLVAPPLAGQVADSAPASPREIAPGSTPQETSRRQSAAPRRVAGRVVRPVDGSTRGVPGTWVVLHRVGSDTAAPLDSVRSRKDGAFEFRYRASGNADAIYFVSADYAGIAYFSPPLREPDVSGAEADIVVFDTTSAPIPLQVRGRHLAVSPPRSDGMREILEVFELSNDSTLTLISRDGMRPTWSVALPPGATDFQAGQGDISADAMRVSQGRVVVVAPIAPGIKQLSFSYRVPGSTFPLSIPLEREVGTLEVLVEEPAARVDGARLSEVAPVSTEGRSFRRFLAQDAPARAVIRIDVPAVSALRGRGLFLATLALAIGAAMLIALAAAFTRRARPTPVPVAQTVAADDPDHLARVIAELDESFDAAPQHDAAERSAYEAQRSVLKQRLSAALDARRRDR